MEDAIDENKNFTFIIQHITPYQPGSVKNYIEELEKQLIKLTAYKPDFINSYTGKDFLSFDENCRIIEASLNIALKMVLEFSMKHTVAGFHFMPHL